MAVVSSYKRTITKSSKDVVSALVDLKTLMADFSPDISIMSTITSAELTGHHKSIIAISDLIKKLTLK